MTTLITKLKTISSRNANTVILLRPQRRRTILPIRAQNQIPRIQLGSCNTIPRRQNATRVPRNSLPVLGTSTHNPRLRRPRRGHRRNLCCGCSSNSSGARHGRRNAHTIPFIAPKRRPTVFPRGPQHRVPRIQLRSRDAVPRRKHSTRVPGNGLRLFITARHNARLRRPRSGHGRGFRRYRRYRRRRSNAHAVPLVRPKRRPAVLSRGPQHRVPGVQLRVRDAVPRGEGVAEIACLRLRVLVARGWDAAGLGGVGRCHGCGGARSDAVVLAGPEVGGAVGAVES